MAGTVSGWGAALDSAQDWSGRKLPLSRLLEDAVHYARDGASATGSQSRFTAEKRGELEDAPGFARIFLPDGKAPAPGSLFRQTDLASTLERIGTAGTEDFYRGELARALAEGLQRAGSPVALGDLEAHHARRVEPLSVRLRNADLYNMTPPTQGLASLMILGLFDRLGVTQADGFAHIHGLVEATKRAFLVRDRYVTDPARMTVDPRGFLTDTALADLAAKIDPARALPWPQSGPPADTIWMGAIDGAGRAVSFIQSVYWEFGSGVVAGDTGVLWQNRGSSFSLDEAAVNALAPGMRPFHTLNPALARFDDGRVMPYGTMGGEGQPQTQAAVFSRYGLLGQELQSGSDGAPLAAGPHLGRRHHQPEDRKPDRRRRDRGPARRRPRRRGGRSLQRHDGPCRRPGAASGRHDPGGIRLPLRRCGRRVLKRLETLGKKTFRMGLRRPNSLASFRPTTNRTVQRLARSGRENGKRP